MPCGAQPDQSARGRRAGRAPAGLGGLAFAAGLIALTLARSELFTEDFLVPVTAVVTKTSTRVSLLRLWAVTMVMNLLGGWLIAAIVVGFPLAALDRR